MASESLSSQVTGRGQEGSMPWAATGCEGPWLLPRHPQSICPPPPPPPGQRPSLDGKEGGASWPQELPHLPGRALGILTSASRSG